jgi:hypothetical protein
MNLLECLALQDSLLAVPLLSIDILLVMHLSSEVVSAVGTCLGAAAVLMIGLDYPGEFRRMKRVQSPDVLGPRHVAIHVHRFRIARWALDATESEADSNVMALTMKAQFKQL